MSFWVLTDARKYIFDKELVNWLKKLLKDTKKIQWPGNYFQAYYVKMKKN